VSTGNLAALITIISTIIGGYYKLKRDQDELQAYVNQRIGKIETDLEWVVSQTRSQQAAYTEGYIMGGNKENAESRAENQESQDGPNPRHHGD